MIRPKKNYLILPVYALLLLFVAGGCTLPRMVNIAQKQRITVQPNPLVANGQQVEFELTISMPPAIVKDGYRYKLDVYYTYGEDIREQVGAVNFEFGEFTYEQGWPTIKKQFSFPYTPKKDCGTLWVQGMAINKKTEAVKYAAPQQVATGLITTPLLMVRNNEVLFIPDNYAGSSDQHASLTFYFEKEQAHLRNYFGSDLQTLDQYIADNVKSQEVTITASQSPDEVGANMALKRAQALEDYYREHLTILDYSNKQVTIVLKPTQDNWEHLIEKIKSSALPKTHIDEVMTIVSSTKKDSEKGAALQETAAYGYMLKYIYPSLRNAEVQINYDRNRKSDYELYLLARRITEDKVAADVLTGDEMQYAATLTPLLAEKKQLYEAAVKATDKWPAYYNLGKVYMEMASKEYRVKAKQVLLAKAIHNLTYAGFRNPTAPVYYSLASAYYVQGDKLKALQHYDYAIKLGGSPEELQRIFADKAALEIEIGQYDDAIESLRYAGNNYQTQMNMGLSYLLKDNYEGAEGYYNQALELKPNDALANYSLAIIAARTHNTQMLTNHLRKALKADNTLTRRAIEDLEFEAYRNKPSYKDAFRAM